MARWYLGLDDFKADQGIAGASQDATLGRAIERASRWLEGEARRVFLPQYAAKKFDIPDSGMKLWFEDDLLSVVSVVDAGGTLAASDYALYPANNSPKAMLELVSSRTWVWSLSRRQQITVAGWWGYPATLSTVGALAAALSSGATSFALADCQVGWMLRCDDELMHVSQVVGSTITVERAQNGTTAATHDSAATVSRYVVDAMAQDAVALAAAAFYASRTTPGIQSRSLGEASISYSRNGAGSAPQEAVNKARLLRRMV
jgi:hypothetical protein